jgi:NhaP-type Na+/H+ or K+/H+ antiporter
LRGGLGRARARAQPPGPRRRVIGEMTLAVVAFSVLAQGSTISKLFQPAYLKGLLK